MSYPIHNENEGAENVPCEENREENIHAKLCRQFTQALTHEMQHALHAKCKMNVGNDNMQSFYINALLYNSRSQSCVQRA